MISFRRKTDRVSLIPKLLIFLLWAWLACLPRADEERPRQAQLDGILRDSWTFYKKHFILEDGRVIRPENHTDTISEGQAYALLRAVWSGDQPTFDRVYRWTLNHLSKEHRNGTYLLAWHFGQDQEGNWRLLDHNSASDATWTTPWRWCWRPGAGPGPPSPCRIICPGPRRCSGISWSARPAATPKAACG